MQDFDAWDGVAITNIDTTMIAARIRAAPSWLDKDAPSQPGIVWTLKVKELQIVADLKGQ
jgi:hypothetical protein